MEQLIADVEAHAAATGLSPKKILRDAIGASWGQWDKWTSGEMSPTMTTADRLRQWMADNPPKSENREKAA